MLLSGGYLFIALAAAAISYIIAHRKGRNAVGWAWASLLLIFPAVIIPFVEDRRSNTALGGNSTERWNNLAAYDPEIKAAIERLRPLGAPAVDEFQRIYSQFENKSAIPEIVTTLEQKWSAHSSQGLSRIETKDGIDILRDTNNIYHVEGRQTSDLKTARIMAAASSRRARETR